MALGAVWNRIHTTAARINARAVPVANTVRRLGRHDFAAKGTAPCTAVGVREADAVPTETAVAILSSAAARSRVEANRSSGSLARHFAINCCNDSGIPPRMDE